MRTNTIIVTSLCSAGLAQTKIMTQPYDTRIWSAIRPFPTTAAQCRATLLRPALDTFHGTAPGVDDRHIGAGGPRVATIALNYFGRHSTSSMDSTMRSATDTSAVSAPAVKILEPTSAIWARQSQTLRNEPIV